MLQDTETINKCLTICMIVNNKLLFTSVTLVLVVVFVVSFALIDLFVCCCFFVFFGFKFCNRGKCII